MKKVVLSLAVLCSVALVACNGNKKAEAADSDTVIAAVEEVATDSLGDTAAVAAVEAVQPNGDSVVAVEAAATEAPAK